MFTQIFPLSSILPKEVYYPRFLQNQTSKDKKKTCLSQDSFNDIVYKGIPLAKEATQKALSRTGNVIFYLA